MVYCCSSLAWQLLVILLLVCLLVCLYVCVCVCVDGVATLSKLVRCFAMLLSHSLYSYYYSCYYYSVSFFLLSLCLPEDKI